MKTLKLLDFEIPSDIKNVCSVVRKVIQYLGNTCGIMDECALFELKVVLNELVSNAIRHGNKGDCSKIVKISAGVTENGYIFLQIEDEGEGYDYHYLHEMNPNAHNTIDICDMLESGRGILIVKNLCDKIKFNQKGNKVIILKKGFKS